MLQVRDVDDSVAAKGVRLVTLLVQSDEMPQEQVCLQTLMLRHAAEHHSHHPSFGTDHLLALTLIAAFQWHAVHDASCSF